MILQLDEKRPTLDGLAGGFYHEPAPTKPAVPGVGTVPLDRARHEAQVGETGREIASQGS
jgi:hypothetical protein